MAEHERLWLHAGGQQSRARRSRGRAQAAGRQHANSLQRGAPGLERGTSCLGNRAHRRRGVALGQHRRRLQQVVKAYVVVDAELLTGEPHAAVFDRQIRGAPGHHDARFERDRTTDPAGAVALERTQHCRPAV